jgi:hypothetical protein
LKGKIILVFILGVSLMAYSQNKLDKFSQGVEFGVAFSGNVTKANVDYLWSHAPRNLAYFRQIGAGLDYYYWNKNVVNLKCYYGKQWFSGQGLAPILRLDFNYTMDSKSSCVWLKPSAGLNLIWLIEIRYSYIPFFIGNEALVPSKHEIGIYTSLNEFGEIFSRSK